MGSALAILLLGLVPWEYVEPVPMPWGYPRPHPRMVKGWAFMKATEELKQWNDQPVNRPGLRRRWILEEIENR